MEPKGKQAYKNFKLMIYRTLFKRFDSDEKKDLTSSEFLCLEVIYLMDKPTISQFAQFLDISSPNATYKVKTLIKKGYLTKEKSSHDKREFILVPTEKFLKKYNEKDEEPTAVKNLSKKEKKNFGKIMDIITAKDG